MSGGNVLDENLEVDDLAFIGTSSKVATKTLLPSAPQSPPSAESNTGDTRATWQNGDSEDWLWSPSFSVMMLLGFTGIILLNVVVPLFSNRAHNLILGAQPSKTIVPKDGPGTVFRWEPQPIAFFPEDSAVLDLYNGSLSPILSLLQNNDFIFVMYYAAWSASSQTARTEFSQAAQFMQPRVPFVAINCWTTNSECRSKYLFYKFPSFYVYASGQSKGFLYAGAYKATYLIRFIESLLNPLTHIRNSSELMSFVSKQEYFHTKATTEILCYNRSRIVSHIDHFAQLCVELSSLVGYFNLSEPEPHSTLQQFYYASLRSIESNFIQPVRFGVLSDSKFASEFSMDSIKPIVLVRSVSDNLVYPDQNNFTSTAISKWVSTNQIEPVVRWHFSQGVKSTTLLDTLSSGPTVLLFTEFDACSQHNKDVSLLREVALSHITCHQNITALVSTKLASYISGSEQSRLDSPTSLCLHCDSSSSIPNPNTCCYSLSQNNLYCQLCSDQSPCRAHCNNMCYDAAYSYLPLISDGDMSNKCVSLWPQNYLAKTQSQVCCGSIDAPVRRVTDKFVERHSHCSSIFTTSRSVPSNTNQSHTRRLTLNRSACASNSSLQFLALDSSLHQEYLTRLTGGSQWQHESKQQLFLVDLKQESHYLMKNEFNRDNIVKFLNDHSERVLPRELISYPKAKHSTHHHNHQQHVSVPDISGDQLTNLLNPTHNHRNSDLVVLFYSKWCIHCKYVSSLFLSVASYFSKKTSIHFYRLDVSSHSLPWKYTVSTVPSIIIFPFGFSLMAQTMDMCVISFGFDTNVQADADKLATDANVTVDQVARHVISHCSRKHLVELAVTKACVTHTLKSLVNIRLKTTQLNREIETLYESISNYRVPLLTRTIRLAQARNLLLKKIYRIIYISIGKKCSKRLHSILKFQPNDALLI